MSDICKEIEKLGKGIGNANRYYILESLMKGPRTVGDVAKALKLRQPSVSQHLKVLKSSDLVTSTRRGQEILYSINVAYMTGLLQKLSQNVFKSKKLKTNK